MSTKSIIFFDRALSVATAISVFALLYVLVGFNGCQNKAEPSLAFTPVYEDGIVPPWTPQGLCDSVEGINLHGPEQTFAGVVDGYIYSDGQILDSWIDGANPYEVLGGILNAEYCEQSVVAMGMFTISGYVDVMEVPDEDYWIIVDVMGHPQPYGLLVGQ